MKKLFKYLLIILPSISCAQTYSVVSVKINGCKAGGNAKINVASEIDSVSFTKDSFEFKEISEPKVAKITVNYNEPNESRKTDTFHIYLTNGHTTVNVSQLDSAFNISVSGPQLAVDYQERLLAPVNRYNSKIRESRIQIQAEEMKTHPDSIIVEQLTEQLNLNVQQCFAVPQTYIKGHIDSQLSLTALAMLGSGAKGTPVSVADLKVLFNSLSENIKNSPDGVKYQEKLRYLESRSN